MGFGVRVYDRNGNAVTVPAGVSVAPEGWSAAAVGGPVAAELRASGPVEALLTLAAWLGYQVQVTSPRGQVVWWGQVATVEVAAGGVTRGVSLAEMVNRLKVLYVAPQAGGSAAAAETAWAEDADSVALYGYRERVYTAGEASSGQATALRGVLLNRLAAPQKVLAVARGEGRGAVIRCVGDWLRLGDVYYSQVAGLEEHAADGDAAPLGLGFTSASVAFAASPQTISEVYGRLGNFGYEGLPVRVTGAASNNGVFTVASADRREAVAYTATTLRFGASDDIGDSANGLAFLATDDIILISGTSNNNGTDIIERTGADGVEVSPGYGGAINNEAAGASVTIRRGNAVTVDQALTNELIGATVTMLAYGQRMYQTFSLGANASWTVDRIELKVRKVGAPADSLRVGLYSDSSGSPGSLLEQADVAAGSIDTAEEWVGWEFANTQQVTYGTTYGLVVQRTGAADPDNFYEVWLDPDGGYTRGSLRLYDGSAYQAVSYDLLFRVLGAEDTATQAARVVQGTETELFGALVESTSSVLSWQFRDGEETGQAVAEGLLAAGTSSGYRMLAQVTVSRWVRIFTAGLAEDARFVWGDDQVLRHVQGSPVEEGLLPVGEWVHLDDAYVAGAWAGLSPFFVERASWRVGQGLSLEAAGQRSVAERLGVRQG